MTGEWLPPRSSLLLGGGGREQARGQPTAGLTQPVHPSAPKGPEERILVPVTPHLEPSTDSRSPRNETRTPLAGL